MPKTTQRPPFGQTLFALRRAAGLTQESIAQQLGLDRSSYTYYETGVSTPTVATLKQLADIFGVSVDYLLGRASHVPSLSVQDEAEIPDSARVLAGLTKDEQTLLMCYRQMSKEDKAVIVDKLFKSLQERD